MLDMMRRRQPRLTILASAASYNWSSAKPYCNCCVRRIEFALVYKGPTDQPNIMTTTVNAVHSGSPAANRSITILETCIFGYITGQYNAIDKESVCCRPTTSLHEKLGANHLSRQSFCSTSTSRHAYQRCESDAACVSAAMLGHANPDLSTTTRPARPRTYTRGTTTYDALGLLRAYWLLLGTNVETMC